MWTFDPGVTYLNHGSFGPPADSVRRERELWSERLARNPMDFFLREMEPALDTAADSLGKLIGCRGDELVFVPNATTAMNIVAENTVLAKDDEILLNDHEYGAVIRIWGRKCGEGGAKTVLAPTPKDVTSPDQIVEAIFSRATSKTKMLIVSHVTSATALVFPVEEICRRAKAMGIPVCIDGPHAIAMRPVQISQLKCEFYCGSLHKWLAAPFGAGFLYVAGGRRSGLQPNLLSWGRSLGGRPAAWKDEFHWVGTADFAPYLAVPAAIQVLDTYGLERFRTTTHTLAAHARQRIIDELEGEPISPDSPDWYGSMVTVRLPWITSRAATPNSFHPLQRFLWENAKIEIPIVHWRDDIHVRVSCHLYNTEEQIDRLVRAIKDWRRISA
jgi:isopenicillin-N epimerase